MAGKIKKQTSTIASHKVKPKKNNKGIHAKTKMSKNKNSKNYFKRSVGQG
jgi:hypothetical protein